MNESRSPKRFPLLDTVNSPADLKKLSDDQLPALCSQIREFLTENILKTGGHLASNLGVVELTVAIHRAFNSPTDSIIWDVGHQSYVHKLLTGRREQFPTLRRPGGLSGFTRRDESPYDPFGAGHSSTSLSAAMGIARAKMLSGDFSYTVAVLGDGAFTGGLIHEALNNIDPNLRLILILNENEMSISRNIGGFAEHLHKLRQSRGYYNTKRVTRNILERTPIIGKPIFHAIRSGKQILKNALYNSNYFEDLGMYYLGPVDGHDCGALENLLSEAKNCGQCAVLHVRTVKGKGYPPAEQNPGLYHGIRPGNAPPIRNFSAQMGDILCKMAEKDGKILAITAAMADGCGLIGFSKRFPDRFFDVGIAEEHALVFAAGLAAQGYKPFFAVYSTFLQRGYDNILHDIALQHLPVTVCIDRAALSAGDGPTHHGIFDVAFLGQVPGIELYAPMDFADLADCMERGASAGRPVFIRYPNSGEKPDLRQVFRHESPGLRACFTPGEGVDAILVTYGGIAGEVVAAATALAKEGIVCGLVYAKQIWPCDPPADFLLSCREAGCNAPILCVEEGIRNGGLGMILSDRLHRSGRWRGDPPEILAIDDPFKIPRLGESCLDAHGISAACIAQKIRELLGK